MTDVVRVCFVCSGNICRSPTAEAVMAQLTADAGLDDRIEVDSAGTGGWHVGDRPDERATAEAARRGIVMRSRARQIRPDDVDRFDWVLAMDLANLRELHALVGGAGAAEKVRLLRSFDPLLAGVPDHRIEVPDPYYGGDSGFAEVFDMVDAACRGLLEHLRAELA